MNKQGIDYCAEQERKLVEYNKKAEHKISFKNIESLIPERMLRIGGEVKVYDIELGPTPYSYTEDMWKIARATLIADMLKDMRFSDREQYTHLPNEIETTKPNIDRQNNIIIGIAVGVMITVCGVIYVVASLIS